VLASLVAYVSLYFDPKVTLENAAIAAAMASRIWTQPTLITKLVYSYTEAILRVMVPLPTHHRIVTSHMCML
jgi:hypothetical protein